MSAPPAANPRAPVRPAAALLLVVALSLLAGGARGIDVLRAVSGHPDVCGFRARYGVDCLGCGGTRAFGEVARGRIPAGFERNPIGAMTALLLWGAVPAASWAWATRRARPLAVWLFVAVPALAATLVVHGVRWWRALPPGLELW